MTGWTEHAVTRNGVRLVVRDHARSGSSGSEPERQSLEQAGTTPPGAAAVGTGDADYDDSGAGRDPRRGEEAGTARPVLLLHGLAGHCGEWDATARWLRERHRVVAFDQRAHGASERRPSDVSRAAYVADVVAVIDALRLAPVILVGQSLGGHTAMLTAAARPDLVRALVMVEASPGRTDGAGTAKVERWLASWPVPFASPAAAAVFFGGGPAGAAWAAGLEERADGWWPRFEFDLMVRSLEEDAAFWDEWRQVACPALLVLAESGIIPSGEVREMARTRPDTVMARVPGAGHDVHLEAPDMWRTALTGFLETL
ncbi:MAG: alpha/beta fold hydrolase [Actinoallomurus sp.]